MDWARRIELVTVVVAAAVAVVGLWYSNVQTRQANDHARQANEQARDDRALAKEGQITDRYTAAVGNLGEDKMDVRLGGIYALQRIMQDSRRDQPTIANVLATYIRTHAAKPPAKGKNVPADVLAALTVLATRDTSRDGAFSLDLQGVKLPNITLDFVDSEADLSGANLRGADLHDANLSDANLSSVDLGGANLAGAILTNTNLRNADLTITDLGDAILFSADLRNAYLASTDLSGATLGGANLSRARMQNTNLRNADLSSADLRHAILDTADLRNADLSSADLRNAVMTKDQFDSATTDSDTRLPISR
ncbi:pentapeptide repeat-containing protein [Streptomyces anulatus]|uniref:pentapeptide repeat-containing protein n=1 Tax=Streptomyces anulatus TaxID=1892 RepID=UPI003F4A5A9D